jgi:lipopolysaccharide export system permease protein
MGKLRQYILSHFSFTFFSIFTPFFVIASVVFLVKMAQYTAVIQFSVSEMLTLYLFQLPEIFFYLMPFTFFIAAAITMHKLSSDNETVVIFSLGLSPEHILRIFLMPAFFLSLILLFSSFYLFPHTTALSKNFLSKKKSEAKFNLQASEFGYKFGDWMLFIGEADKKQTFKDAYLFNKSQSEEVLISAEQANVINEHGVLRLKLSEGEGYTYTDETLSQMDFQTLFINDMLSSQQRPYKDAWTFWSDPHKNSLRYRQLMRNVATAIFPLMSLTMILVIGVINSRHQHGNFFYVYIMLTVLGYYTFGIALEPMFDERVLFGFILLWVAATTFLYRRIILSRY